MSYNGPIDYCKHGVYVGGCGIDWMCGACENGDPDLTVNEAKRILADEGADIARLWNKLVQSPDVDAGEVFTDLCAPSTGGGWFQKLTAAARQVEAIAGLADGPDDDDYLARRHDAEIRAYNAEMAAEAVA